MEKPNPREKERKRTAPLYLCFLSLPFFSVLCLGLSATRLTHWFTTSLLLSLLSPSYIVFVEACCNSQLEQSASESQSPSLLHTLFLQFDGFRAALHHSVNSHTWFRSTLSLSKMVITLTIAFWHFLFCLC